MRRWSEAFLRPRPCDPSRQNGFGYAHDPATPAGSPGSPSPKWLWLHPRPRDPSRRNGFGYAHDPATWDRWANDRPSIVNGFGSGYSHFTNPPIHQGPRGGDFCHSIPM